MKHKIIVLKEIPRKIFVFTHPDFLQIKSIERYANWIVNGLNEKGYNTTLIKPSPSLSKYFDNKIIKKYFGYLDLFFLFPFKIKTLVRKNKHDSLFILADQALGPWVKYFPTEKLVIHCHDFLAQLSAFNQFPQNILSKSGKIYQRYIKNGYTKGRNFICISENTKDDLLNFLPKGNYNIDVVYNGIDPVFKKIISSNHFKKDLNEKYILHVGGNQWYKNRIGVIKSYIYFRQLHTDSDLELILVGESLTEEQLKLILDAKLEKEISVKQNVTDTELIKYYSNAELLLFPSLAEGFGWPIAEALYCGQVVLITNKAPLNEVGGMAAIYLPEFTDDKSWYSIASNCINGILQLSTDKRNEIINIGKQQVLQFDSEISLAKIEKFYLDIYNLT